MKNVLSELKAKNYFCRLEPKDAKKVLFAMEQMKPNERMSDSNVPELQYIASLFDGVIQSEFAKDLANKLQEAYEQEHPKTFMTDKEALQYKEVNFNKLLAAIGLRGLDYVIDVLGLGKTEINSVESQTDEEQMLRAMRWEERRMDNDPEISNLYHRRKGLELVGFEDMADELVKYSFIIASIYEQILPKTKIQVAQANSVRQIKIHIIEFAELVEEFYNTNKPIPPAGYSATQLSEGSILLELATEGKLKDSEEVVKYYDEKVKWQDVSKQLAEEFSTMECEIIEKYRPLIEELIKNEW